MTGTKPSIPLRYHVEYGLVRLLRGLLLSMPVDLASFLMGKIWRLLAPLNGRHERVLRHMDWALGDEMDRKERERCARAMWENIGRTFCEGLISDRLLREKWRFRIEDDAFRHWSEECRNGALLITHHFGNWELTSAPTVLFTDHEVMGIYKRVKNPLVESYFLKIRAPLFPGGLFSQQRGAARHAISRIKAGSDMAMVADLRDNRGVRVELFGMPAFMTSFPATLALRFDKPLFVAQLRRLRGARFILDMRKIEFVPSGDFSRDCEALTQAMHRQFERWIRDNPHQWMWAPYRWSGRRDEQTKPEPWTESSEGSTTRFPQNLDN